MIKLFIGMIIGMLVGVPFGIFATAFCTIAKVNDEYSRKYMKEREQE